MTTAEDPKPKVYETLCDLLIEEGEPTGNQRAYCVELPPHGDGTVDSEVFVVSNSHGNAALAVVGVATVKRSDMLAAARLVINQAKSAGK